MSVIAHITDPHLIEDVHGARSVAGRARLACLSFGRRLDAVDRAERFERVLAEAWASRAEHVVITGDLTEDGDDLQFEVLAELLHASRLRPERVTLVPGNHDAYACGGAWQRALEGPLAQYAPTSCKGAVVELSDATIVPMSTAQHQGILQSAGWVAKDDVERLAELSADPAFARKPLVVAQHHPPTGLPIPVVQWVDGLQDDASLRTLLAEREHLTVLHGHTHRKTDRQVARRGIPRIFGAEAVVESESPLRLYETCPLGLMPVADESDAGVGIAALASA